MSEQSLWELRLWELFLVIVGVLIGFLLSQIPEWMKNRKREKVIRKALVNELSIIRKTLSNGLKSKDQNRISDEQYPLLTQAYDSVKTELASFLKPESLSKVQRTYEEIGKMNLGGRGHIVIPPSSHIFQFTDFHQIITLIDDSIAQLR